MTKGLSLPVLLGSEFLPGAHHPHCPKHKHHLLWFGGQPLCLGCTCMAVGFVAGALSAALAWPSEGSLLGWIALHAAMVAPTLAQPWLQWKPYKVLARFMLGVASATWLAGCLVPKGTGYPLLTEAGVAVTFFLALAKVLLWVRERATESPCTRCPMGAYPTCAWNLPRLLASTDDTELRVALLSLGTTPEPLTESVRGRARAGVLGE